MIKTILNIRQHEFELLNNYVSFKTKPLPASMVDER